jgi:hypothetical protein
VIPEIRVDGANRLAQVSRALKAASPHLRRELAKGIREGTEPVKQEALANILPTLPRGGGLAQDVLDDTKIVTQRRGGSANPGIRLRARSRRNVRRFDRGSVRHPLFGDKEHWFTQKVEPGWFTVPVLRSGDRLRRVLLEHIDRVARKIGESAR